tara:strand:+ start:10835 stop:11239 length:405 start_codon:yes stop_codon:yes gene_type:complete
LGKRVAFVNGCFDVLHFGHLKLLEFARNDADFLIVAIDSDSRVKESKGDSRPFNKQEVRKYFLQSLRFVDRVEVFASDSELEQLVRLNNPDVMIVGSDYRNKTVIGSQYAKELKFFERIDDHSTTKILQHTSNR